MGNVRDFFFFKQKTAYEIKECDWSSDVCSSDLNQFALWGLLQNRRFWQNLPSKIGLVGKKAEKWPFLPQFIAQITHFYRLKPHFIRLSGHFYRFLADQSRPRAHAPCSSGETSSTNSRFTLCTIASMNT